MAEVAYSAVKDLAGLLKDEVDLLSGVREEVKAMERMLKRIQAFLKDADSAPHNVRRDERTKQWVEEIREVAFEAQDVIEDFCILKKQRPATNKHGCFKRCLKREVREISSNPSRRESYFGLTNHKLLIHKLVIN
ncbi:putative disease resistance protein [Acorus gramineus]|uniref:Disease resistance protein n=1 Tax=Acorus gramineus TaxID=55184 RepID=A0AAV9BE37_ACOGR|nr:putative disease resistance protein [Acorus gramineus]